MDQQPELTIICCCRNHLSGQRIHRFQQKCSQLILVYLTEIESSPDTDDALIIPWERAEGKVAALNNAIQQATAGHILWLENNEILPEIPQLEENTFYPARISNTKAELPVFNWQIRLFPTSSSQEIFLKGSEIPEIYSVLRELKVQQSDYQLNIRRRGELFPSEDIQKEADMENESPMHAFWKGMAASAQKRYASASRFFKSSLKEQDLTTWNRLAAFNNLANSLMGFQEWKEARKTAEQSLSITNQQRSPYLTLYQYYNMKGEDEKAYEQLTKYQKVAETETRANWDVYMPEAHVVFLMADISSHQGWHEQAYRYYEQFYKLNDGQVSRAIREVLFLYAVELQQREKAIHYFNALFGEYLAEWPDNEDQSVEVIREALSLITENGWYDFAADIYKNLLTISRMMNHCDMG